MKVLLTGCTNLQVGRTIAMGYVEPHLMLHKLMVLAGWTVDLRAVVPGEDLSTYDRIIVGPWSFHSRVGSWSYGALWAYSWRDRIPVGAVLNDWTIQPWINGYQSIAQKGREALFTNLVHNHRDEAEAVGDTLYQTVCGLVKEYPPYLVTLFPWEHVKPELTWDNYVMKTIVPWDPTALVNADGMRGGSDPEVRSRAWVLAALHDHESYVRRLGANWPIKKFGVKKLNQPRLKEREVVEQYMANWGMIVPLYKKQAGNGGWRPRIPFALYSGAIIHMHPSEFFSNQPGCHILSPDIPKLEAFSTDQLYNYQQKQAMWVTERAWSRERALNTPLEFVENLHRVCIDLAA